MRYSYVKKYIHGMQNKFNIDTNIPNNDIDIYKYNIVYILLYYSIILYYIYYLINISLYIYLYYKSENRTRDPFSVMKTSGDKMGERG